MEYTDIRYSDITTCIDSVSARGSTTGGRMVSKWIVWGRAVSCLHNQSTQSQHNWLLVDGIHSHKGTVTLLRYWFCECQSSTTGGRMVSKWIVWGRAVSCLHNQAPNWNTIDSLWWNTPHQVQWHYYVYWFCECQSSTTGGRWSPNELYEGEQSHAYIIKHPISTQLTSCDGIHWHQVQWHYYVYWFCECQSWRTGGRMVSKWIVWGRAVSCLHNQAPNWNTIDFLWWNTLTSGTVTLLRYWFCECQSWRLGTDGLQMNCVGESTLMLHNQAPNLNTIDFLRWNTLTSGTVTLLLVLILWVPEAAQLEDGMVSKWIVWGRAVSCLHNQAPNLNTIDSLWWNTLTSGTVTLLRVLDSVSARAGELGRMVSKWIVWGRAVSCLHNQAPNLNTIDFLWWNTLTSGTVTLLRVLILWVPEQHNWGRMVFKWIVWGRAVSCLHNQAPNLNTLTSCDGIHSTSGTVTLLRVIDSVSARAGELGRMVSKWIVWGRALFHAYIIKHPISTQLTSCDEYTDIRYSDITTCIDSVSARSSTTGGRMVSKWIVWGRAVSCLHNQAPNWNTIDFLRWNTLTSGTVTLLRVLILWVPELENWGTDSLQMNCVRESSLMLT